MSTRRQIRITLVSIHPYPSPQSIPLAAAFLAATLKNVPYLDGRLQLTLLDLYTSQTAEECATAIRATTPNLAGFSVYLWNRALSVATANLLKKAQPDIGLFCGGPEGTADRERLLSQAPWDFLVNGEGEGPLTAAVQAIVAGGSPAGIPGIALLHRGGLQYVPAREPADLGKLPSPLLSGEIDPGKYGGMLWQISRGCSFGCDFCYDGGGNRSVRRFPLERIEGELRWFVKHGVSQVFVLDSTFNSDRQRAVSILKLIKKHAPGIHFHFEVRSEFLDLEQARLFASITCSLQIGLQSADPKVLKDSGRVFNGSDFAAKVGLLNDSGAIFGFDLIYGLPGDSLAKFRESLDFALGLYPNHLDIFPLALLPGTKLALRSKELDLEHQQVPPYLLHSSPTFPKKDMTAAARLAAACDLFYSRGKAVPWFLASLYPLKLKPSRFLELFSGYADKKGVVFEKADRLDDGDIFRLQTGFITELFTERRLTKLLPVALDQITYNYHYAAALLARPPLPSRRPPKVAVTELKLSLAPSARLAAFSSDILQLLDAGTLDLRELAAACPPTGSHAVIYPKRGQVMTEALHHLFWQLLERLDGKMPAGRVAAGLGITPADAAQFLEFALREGIGVMEE